MDDNAGHAQGSGLQQRSPELLFAIPFTTSCLHYKHYYESCESLLFSSFNPPVSAQIECDLVMCRHRMGSVHAHYVRLHACMIR